MAPGTSPICGSPHGSWCWLLHELSIAPSRASPAQRCLTEWVGVRVLPRDTGTPLETFGHAMEDMQKVLGSPGSPTPLGRWSVGAHPACARLTHWLPSNLWLSHGSSQGSWGRAAPQNCRETFGGTRGGCLTCPRYGSMPAVSHTEQAGRAWEDPGENPSRLPGSLSRLSCSGGGRNEPPRDFPPASGVGRAMSCGVTRGACGTP